MVGRYPAVTFRKIVLLLATFLTVANPALATQSKLMVVHRHLSGGNGASAEQAASEISNNRVLRMYANLFDRFGVNAKFVEGKLTKTLFVSNGIQVWNYGTAAAYADTFQAVALVNVLVGGMAGYSRFDSTLRIAYNSTGGPTIPQLWSFHDMNLYGGSNSGVPTVACCTTGVASIDNADGQVFYHSGTTNTFIQSGAYSAGAVLSSTAPSGGFRKHIDNGNAAQSVNQSTAAVPQACDWCDSIQVWRGPTTISADTVVLWERPFPSGKSAVMLWADGAGGVGPTNTDSAGTTCPIMPSEVDPTIMVAGLSRLDSLLNHTLITKTLKRSIVIHGLCSRGGRAGSLGIFSADTTVAYASMDSIKALGVRVIYTINADPDSMSAYARDIYKAMENPLAKFAPEIWTAVSDTGLVAPFNGGNTQRHRPRDVWGRYRNRIAYGDGSGAGKDSSLWANLMWAKFLCDSATNNRTSTFLIAPMDDWSPKNTVAGYMPRDSVFYAITKAGFVGVELDVQYPASVAGSAGEGRTNPTGYQQMQERAWSPYSNQPVKLLGHDGYFLGGSASQLLSNVTGPTWVQPIYSHLNRIWSGFLFDYDDNNDVWQIPPMGGTKGWWSQGSDDYTHRDAFYRTIDTQWGSRPKAAYIANIRFNDISGHYTAGGDPASRWGWWVIKSVANACRTINELDGKSVISLDWPENIDP